MPALGPVLAPALRGRACHRGVGHSNAGRLFGQRCLCHRRASLLAAPQVRQRKHGRPVARAERGVGHRRGRDDDELDQASWLPCSDPRWHQHRSTGPPKSAPPPPRGGGRGGRELARVGGGANVRVFRTSCSPGGGKGEAGWVPPMPQGRFLSAGNVSADEANATWWVPLRLVHGDAPTVPSNDVLKHTSDDVQTACPHGSHFVKVRSRGTSGESLRQRSHTGADGHDRRTWPHSPRPPRQHHAFFLFSRGG